jgi:cell division protease FtsH
MYPWFMDRKKSIHLTYIVLAMFGVLWLQGIWQQYAEVDRLTYSEFLGLLKTDKVQEIEISNDEIRGRYKEPLNDKKAFVTVRVDPRLVKELEPYAVKYSMRRENPLLPLLLSWVVPIMLFGGLWFLVIRRITQGGGPGGGLMAIGKSKAKIYVETDTKTSFQDVAGVEEAKHELEEIVSFLKDPLTYGRLGARMPRGVLLVGPPGTGKTLLARAVAGEANVPFFSISGSEFVEMFVGVGAARVRDLFEQARQKAPAIIFIDELDALGRARNSQPFGGGHDEKEQTLNQLLVELDGFDASTGLVLIAATNRPEILDPALLRAGRFDRQVLVDRPDRPGRIQILRVHSKKIQLAEGVDLEQVASLTPGFTGADLANLVNEAALVATRRDGQSVNLEDFTQAIERIVAGLEKKNRLLNPKEREVVAHHEMGHALVAAALAGSDPVHKISIIPRGIAALGYTLQRPIEERYLMTREELENKMAILLGGRVAEQIIYNQLSTGASDDLDKATDIARNMATRYGMVPELGFVTYDKARNTFLGSGAPMFSEHTYSEDTAREIDCAVRTLVKDSIERAHSILETHRQVLEVGSRELLEKETLTEPDIKRIFASVFETGRGSTQGERIRDH